MFPVAGMRGSLNLRGYWNLLLKTGRLAVEYLVGFLDRAHGAHPGSREIAERARHDSAAAAGELFGLWAGRVAKTKKNESGAKSSRLRPAPCN